MLYIIKTYWPIFLTCVSLISLVIQTLLVKTYAKREEVASLGSSLGGEVAVLGSRLMLVEKRIKTYQVSASCIVCSLKLAIYAVSCALLVRNLCSYAVLLICC